MLNKQAAKRRIKSIQSTRKTTNAMRLVSTTKLRKARIEYETTKEYAQAIELMLRRIASLQEGESQWTTKRTGKRVVLVVVSDMGLCGSYNANIVAKIREDIPTDAELYVIGKKNRRTLMDLGYSINEEVVLSDSFVFKDMTLLVNQMIRDFISGELAQLDIVYTQYLNTLTYRPMIKQLLPLAEVRLDGPTYHVYTDYEPSETEIMKRLVPQFLKSVFNNLFYESKTSEQSARRMAMEQATDNADELIEILQLKYNQARQAAITQELTELVAAGER